MSLFLYSTEFLEPLPSAQFQLLLDLLPDALQQKVLKYRRWEDSHASLLGKLLLRLALENVGYPSDLSRLHYGEWQKPGLPQGPEFSITHSGNRALCMLSTRGRTGIDIEFLKPLAFEDFKDQFTQREWTAIHAAPTPLDSFYHFWTAKESLIKADGRGLGIPLQGLDLSKGNTLLLDGQLWFTRELPLFKGYAFHFSIEGTDPPPIKFHEVPPYRLLELSRGWTRF